MKKIVIFTVFIGCIIFCTNCTDLPKPLTVTVFKIENGFGYSINRNDKILIKQAYIPTLQENKTFCTRSDAQKTADLVVDKLLNKKSPAITINELEMLQIDFKCLDLR